MDFTRVGVGVTYGPTTERWANVTGGPSTSGLPGHVAWRDGVGVTVARTAGDEPRLVGYRPTAG
jgi:hypothetical protein